jgi:predicted nucleic-acid-binding protein
MIGIDTNILVRYLTQDDETQLIIASRIINQYENKPESIFISNIVLCELIWVLERGYKYNKKEIVNALQAILSTIEFAFEYHEILWLCLSDYEKFTADFSDILLGKVNKLHNCEYTVTFDSKAAALKGFKYAI